MKKMKMKKKTKIGATLSGFAPKWGSAGGRGRGRVRILGMAIHLTELNAEERQRLEVTETDEHQEARSRERVDWSAVWKVALAMGAYFFLFPGGTPWTSGSPGGVMGRSFEWAWPALVVAHLALCYAYTMVIAHAVYVLRTISAFFAGVAVGGILYVLNLALFMGTSSSQSEMRAMAAHVIFGGIAAVMYKALSVPVPRMKLDGEEIIAD
jgi:hypothetical protein